MKWTNESSKNPGYSVYAAIPERNPEVLYVIRKKKDGGNGWRVYTRSKKTEPLHVIFAGEKTDTLKVCKKFVKELEEVLGAR